MEKLKMLQSAESGETNTATWHHLTSEGCSFPKNCFLQNSVIPYIQSQSIFNALRFPSERINPLQKTLFFTVVPTCTWCMWALRQEGLKEHTPSSLLPRSTPGNWCNTCAECKWRGWLDTVVPLGLQNLNITGLALNQMLGGNWLERICSHEALNTRDKSSVK